MLNLTAKTTHDTIPAIAILGLGLTVNPDHTRHIERAGGIAPLVIMDSDPQYELIPSQDEE